VRLFIELDISASAIDGSKGNTEQKLFVHMLKKAQESSLFRFPQTPSREKLKEIVVALAKKEVEECTGTPQEVKRCERAVGVTKSCPLTASLFMVCINSRPCSFVSCLPWKRWE
jgi:CO dehydrogenase/acetyl-CoA synthase epsilon subunit